jgi:maleylacetoacetate isomerase
MKIYTFWRSIATFRVRIALNIKGITPDTETIDILTGDQHTGGYDAVNPQKLLPSLVLDDGGPPLFQSMAIMEYLEETHPHPRLLPADPRGRARVRGLSQIAVSDAHPLSVPRVRNYLGQTLKLDQSQVAAWIRHWQTEALGAFESHLSNEKETGRHCHGDSVTLADICLAGQVVGAQYVQVDVKTFPTVARIFATCMQDDAFARAHPLRQPGAPAEVAH